MSDELFLRIVSDPGAVGDPYPLLRQLREISPVHKVGFSNLWVFTRFEHCQALLSDSRIEVPEAGSQTPGVMPGAFTASGIDRHRSMMMLNPPEHTRVRALASLALDPLLEVIPSLVQQATNELVDSLAASGGGDIVERLAYPLPGRVLCDLVGVPRSEQPWLRELALGIASGLEPGYGLDKVREFADARNEFINYVSELVAQRSTAPGDDFVSSLIAVRDGEQRLTPEEVASTTALLYAAGLETTASLLSSMVHTLLQWPDQLSLLRADGSLARGAVAEVLRFEAPLQCLSRRANADIALDGAVVTEGASVLLLLGAANRDPLVVADPERFDISRAERTHLSFGAGIHRCFGAVLALSTGATVLNALLERFGEWVPRYTQPAWKPRFALRSLETLPVELR